MSEQAAIRKPKPGAGWALALLLTINLFNYIDRYVLSAVVPPLKQDLHLTDEQTGMLASAFLYAYMFAAPLFGRLSERFSRWYIIGSSVIVWSLASGWTGWSYSFYALLASRIMVGIGEAGYGPAAPALIADYYPIERRGKVMALFYLAMPVGAALGFVLGGYINHEFKSWRTAFHFAVIPGLLLGLWCFLKREPARSAAPPKVQKNRSFLGDAKVLLRIKSYALNTAAMTAMTFAIGGIAFWIPTYLFEEKALQEGLTQRYVVEQASGTVSAQTQDQLDVVLKEVTEKFGKILVVAGLISTLLGGWLADKLRARWSGAYFGLSGIAILLAFPCTLAMLWWPFPWRWVGVFGAIFFLFFNTGPANTALANVTSSKMRATAFALNIFLLHAFGDAFSPPLIGWVKGQSSWATAFVLVSLMMILASVLWLIGARYLAKDEEAAIAGDLADAAADAKG
jgi:MFS family permease